MYNATRILLLLLIVAWCANSRPQNHTFSTGVMDEEDEVVAEQNDGRVGAHAIAVSPSSSTTAAPMNTATFAAGALEQGVGAYSTPPLEFSVGGATHLKPVASSGGDNNAGGKRFMGAFVSKLGSMTKELDAKMDKANK